MRTPRCTSARASRYPLGATWDGAGVNFALFSTHATGVDLCLFDTPESPYERLRVPLPNAPMRCGTAICPSSAGAMLRLSRLRSLYAA